MKAIQYTNYIAAWTKKCNNVQIKGISRDFIIVFHESNKHTV